MTVVPPAELRAITSEDLSAVGEFLHKNLNPRVSAASWAESIAPPWPVESPNHGFMLTSGGEPVGVYLAFYSDRVVDGTTFRICNLAAWCVLEPFRSHSVRLLRSILRQSGYQFTDLSPSGSVVPLNLRLKFTALDTTSALSVNLPWQPWSRGARLVTDHNEIERLLHGPDSRVFADHRHAAAACHVLIVRGAETCYVIFRRDRRKNIPIFASILYVGNRDLFRTTSGLLARHLLVRRRIPFTLSELRVVGRRPRASIMLKKSRPKMFKSDLLTAAQIDYLYSELTCVAW